MFPVNDKGINNLDLDAIWADLDFIRQVHIVFWHLLKITP
jgi:hypothetical protein